MEKVMTYKDIITYLGIICGLIVALVAMSALFVGDILFSSDEWQNPRHLCIDDGGKWIEAEQRCDCGTGRHNDGYYCADN